MSIDSKLGHFFKSEIKVSGLQEFKKATVFISNHSDTQIQATMKSMIPIRVSLKSDSIESPDFNAKCSCSVYGKGNLCKHIWALILTVEQKYPDFLDSKSNIEITAQIATPKESLQKEKQTEYKKSQYEKQKQWAKDIKAKKEKDFDNLTKKKYSDEIEAALKYFTINGFDVDESTDEEFLNKAKKSLSRIFHPDKGGSHEESIALNQNFQILIDFIRSL
jgi:hypothetical protein